jgi:hypothetical protein
MGHRLRTEAAIAMAECSSCEHGDVVLAALETGYMASPYCQNTIHSVHTTLALPCFQSLESLLLRGAKFHDACERCGCRGAGPSQSQA